jgi:transposase
MSIYTLSMSATSSSTHPCLFPVPETDPSPAPSPAPEARTDVRVLRANRTQLIWGSIDLEAQVPEDHPVRAIVGVIERFDLSAFYAEVGSYEGEPGAPAIDPRILLSLWVFATSEGEGSAREIARLTTMHAAYRWICGGVEVGYHTLSDFRRRRGKGIDDLITQLLGVLMQQELVVVSRVAQDGTRTRAAAGAASFRREETLEERMKEAREHMEAVTREGADETLGARRAAARRRGAQERLARREAALAQLPAVAETKKRSGAKDATPRVSTTDPEARVMKMADGGFRPALNVQIATTTDAARVIVGIDVTNRGTDAGAAIPMIEQIERRTGVRPQEMLVDGGYVQLEAIEQAAARGVDVYAPVPTPRGEVKRDPHEPREGDSPAVADWRVRMGTEEAKETYKQRAATAETVNADAKAHRGLDRLPVRGLDKAGSVVALFALTYNVLRVIALGG